MIPAINSARVVKRMTFYIDETRKPTKTHPRTPAGFSEMPWCFGQHSRRDKLCEDCAVEESCFVWKEG